MVSLQLADRVATLLPEPAHLTSAADLRRAARMAPQYQTLLDEFTWLTLLWREGIVRGELEGRSPLGAIRRTLARLAEEDAWEVLRRFVDVDRFTGDVRALDALAHDILRGGPDPAMTIPLVAGLDAFALAGGAIAARGPAESIAQRAELAMGRRCVHFAIPAVIQGEASVLLRVRHLLEARRIELVDAIEGAFVGDAEPVRRAARAYADTFDALRDEIERVDDPDDVMVRIEQVTIRAVRLPEDAVLRSSVEAAYRFERMATMRLDEPSSLPLRSLIIAQVGGGC